MIQSSELRAQHLVRPVKNGRLVYDKSNDLTINSEVLAGSRYCSTAVGQLFTLHTEE